MAARLFCRQRSANARHATQVPEISEHGRERSSHRPANTTTPGKARIAGYRGSPRRRQHRAGGQPNTNQHDHREQAHIADTRDPPRRQHRPGTQPKAADHLRERSSHQGIRGRPQKTTHTGNPAKGRRPPPRAKLAPGTTGNHPQKTTHTGNPAKGYRPPPRAKLAPGGTGGRPPGDNTHREANRRLANTVGLVTASHVRMVLGRDRVQGRESFGRSC